MHITCECVYTQVSVRARVRAYKCVRGWLRVRVPAYVRARVSAKV